MEEEGLIKGKKEWIIFCTDISFSPLSAVRRVNAESDLLLLTTALLTATNVMTVKFSQ